MVTKQVIPIKIKPKNKEQQHEENLRRIKALRPIDDNFMQVLFRNDRPLAQMVLRIIILLTMGKLSIYDISAASGLTIEEVKEIAEENGIITV